jgi:hypothetical protein
MARKRSKRGSKASAARSKRKGKARAAPTERRAQPKGVINAWEDDPGAGNQPSGGQVIQRPTSTPPCHWAGKSGGVVCLRMSSATRRRRAPKRPRVRRYSISSSAYALWPPLRLWPFSPARHFKDIARRLVDRRAYFNRIHVVDPRHARGAVLQAQMLNASSATIPIPIVSTASATGS